MCVNGVYIFTRVWMFVSTIFVRRFFFFLLYLSCNAFCSSYSVFVCIPYLSFSSKRWLNYSTESSLLINWCVSARKNQQFIRNNHGWRRLDERAHGCSPYVSICQYRPIGEANVCSKRWNSLTQLMCVASNTTVASSTSIVTATIALNQTSLLNNSNKGQSIYTASFRSTQTWTTNDQCTLCLLILPVYSTLDLLPRHVPIYKSMFDLFLSLSSLNSTFNPLGMALLLA